MSKFNSSAFLKFQCSCVAQSTSDRDVTLRREQIKRVQHVWTYAFAVDRHTRSVLSLLRTFFRVFTYLYCRLIVCSVQRHTFSVICNVKQLLWKHLRINRITTPLFTNQMGMIPLYAIPCSCSKLNWNDLTIYERNSDSNFVVVAQKPDFLFAITTSATDETYDSASDNI